MVNRKWLKNSKRLLVPCKWKKQILKPITTYNLPITEIPFTMYELQFTNFYVFPTLYVDGRV